MKSKHFVSAPAIFQGAINPQVNPLERVPSPEGIRRVFHFAPVPTKSFQNNNTESHRSAGLTANKYQRPVGVRCLSPRNVIPFFSSDSSGFVPNKKEAHLAEPVEKENSPIEVESATVPQQVSVPQKLTFCKQSVPSLEPPAAHLKVGRWTKLEHATFLEGMEKYPKQWKRITDLIGSRTVLQVRTHAQKFFQSTKMVGNANKNLCKHSNVTNRKTTVTNTTKQGQNKKSRVPKRKYWKRKQDISRNNRKSEPAGSLEGEFSWNTTNQEVELDTVHSHPFKKARARPDTCDSTIDHGFENSLIGACRFQDGVHSRNSVDAVSALLSLKATYYM